MGASTFKNQGIEVHHADCMELMAKYPDNHFELCIVDPPYGISASKGASTNGTMRKKIASGEIKGGDWDDNIPPTEYFDELFRVSKNQIIWGGNYFISHLSNSMGFIIWDKGESIYGRCFAECEFAWISFQKAARIYKLFPNQKDRIHPTQKPVKLYKWILSNYAKPGDKILDTHLGSGSIAIACHDLGFELTASELDEDYFAAAVDRIQRHQQQTLAFDG